MHHRLASLRTGPAHPSSAFAVPECSLTNCCAYARAYTRASSSRLHSGRPLSGRSDTHDFEALPSVDMRGWCTPLPLEKEFGTSP